jgi:beta-glucosidase
MINRKWVSWTIILVFILLASSSSQSPQKSAVYKDVTLPIEQRIENLLSHMTLSEKIDQLSGTGFNTPENKRLGIPPLRMTDGPIGVRWGQATAFPASVATSATWNVNLTRQVAAAIANEVKAKGRNMLLGPCVNIHRFPLGGRNFESYGEDPFLASRLAVAYINGVQAQGVLASVKHFACNNQEWQRNNLDVTLNERAFREIYLPAFKAAVTEAHVYSVMCSYNLLRGEHCSQNSYLLDHILKKEWRFPGFVVSDWESVYSTVKAARAGLDLEMPFGKFFGNKLLQAVKTGKVSQDIIDDKVRRLLRVRFKAGLFDPSLRNKESPFNQQTHKQLALQAAQESLVLLKNRDSILPLDFTKIKKVAVIGPNALDLPIGGGGSSKVSPFYAISPLEGINKTFPSHIQIDYALGISIRGDIDPLRSPFIKPQETNEVKFGLNASYFNNKELLGEPIINCIDPKIDFNWGYDFPYPVLKTVNSKKHYSVRWTGALLPPQSGIYKINVIHNDGIRVYLNEQLLIDHWKSGRTRFHSAEVPLVTGKSYKLRIEYFFDGGLSLVKFGWQLPDHDYIGEAVKLAKAADVAIVFAGLHQRFESEGFDRQRLQLPNQDVLIQAVAKANPRTIVVLFTGTPVLMNPWIHQVAALVQAWYPGQEGGNAVSLLLIGKYSPSGKLPFSMIEDYKHSPAFKDYRDKSLKSPYPEGIFVGYRYLDKHRIKALFPFGFGLSYTQFNYSALQVTQHVSPQMKTTVTMTLKNTGTFPGAEIVQLYVRDVECSIERPLKELKGFAKVYLEPGQSKTITMKLDRQSFAFFDPLTNQWIVEAGAFDILIGSSAKHIHLKSRINIK